MNDTGYYYFLDPAIDSEEYVLKIREKAMCLYMEGKTTMEWMGEGISSKKQFTAPIEAILRETRYCLKQMNPQKYGAIVKQSKVLRMT